MRRHEDLRTVHALQDDIMDQQIQSFPHAVPQHIRVLFRKLIFGKNLCPDSIIDIMVNIGNLVRKAHDTSLQCRRMTAGSVVHDAIADFPGKI